MGNHLQAKLLYESSVGSGDSASSCHAGARSHQVSIAKKHSLTFVCDAINDCNQPHINWHIG